jgi:meso-butanediol dehydrogenase / (S,S)-butanediol dehydrogenase / diacetyl reductase
MASKDGARDRSRGPVVLVTGASAGIGEAIVRRFAAEGYRIVAIARRQNKLDQLAQSLSGIAEVAVLSADVSLADTADRGVALAIERFGRLDCLVNNAGSGKWAAVGDTEDSMMDEVIDISLKAPLRFCRAAVRVMKPGAAIINIGSTWGLIGGVGGGVYCAVKSALVGLTRSMAADYGPKGIRCNLIAPGVVRTDMTEEIWTADFFQRLNHEMTPFDREGTVEDVANSVFFLASKEGSYINGQSIALDGGWTAAKYLTPEALVAARQPLADAAE